jgi:hypothetical protein
MNVNENFIFQMSMKQKNIICALIVGITLNLIIDFATRGLKNIRRILMITKTKQDWSIGNIVKVGFLQLKIVGARAEKDFMPDIYELVDERNGYKYEFIPHNGLFKIY